MVQYPQNRAVELLQVQDLFLGTTNLTFDQWVQVASAAGGWLAAGGTIAAAWVALHLAGRSEKVRLKVKVTRAMSFEGMGGHVADGFLLSATNLGPRPVSINGWAWCVGKGKSQLSMWSKRPLSPGTIAYGETAKIEIDVGAHETWQQIAQGLVEDCKVKSLDKVRLEVYPTVGSAVRVVPDQEVLDFLGPFFEDAKWALQNPE